MKISRDRLLDIIQQFYVNETLNKDEQSMIDDLIETATGYLDMTEELKLDKLENYKQAILTVINSDIQDGDDEAMYLSSVKTYLQGVLNNEW